MATDAITLDSSNSWLRTIHDSGIEITRYSCPQPTTSLPGYIATGTKVIPNAGEYYNPDIFFTTGMLDALDYFIPAIIG
jgi:hypothetical protein